MYDGWTEDPEVSQARRSRADAVHEQWKQAQENAEIAEWLDDPRTPIEQVIEVMRKEAYDFTPAPFDMPDIDMDNVKEIPF